MIDGAAAMLLALSDQVSGSKFFFWTFWHEQILEREESVNVVHISLVGIGKLNANKFRRRPEMGTFVAQVAFGNIPSGAHESKSATSFPCHVTMKNWVDQRLRRLLIRLCFHRKSAFQTPLSEEDPIFDATTHL